MLQLSLVFDELLSPDQVLINLELRLVFFHLCSDAALWLILFVDKAVDQVILFEAHLLQFSVLEGAEELLLLLDDSFDVVFQVGELVKAYVSPELIEVLDVIAHLLDT